MPTKHRCECKDPGCPSCMETILGLGDCPNPAISTLYRVDMQDQTGTPMCVGCALDAMESGLFRTD